MNIFGLPGSPYPGLSGTYPKSIHSQLLIDLWMEDFQIWMIFSFFSWKCWESPDQDWALIKYTNWFGRCCFHVCLNKYKDDWNFCFSSNHTSLYKDDRGILVSTVWCKWFRENVIFCHISWFSGLCSELCSLGNNESVL